MNDGYFEVHFLDVGQASASMIMYENKARSDEEGRTCKEAVIIDCGRSPAEVVDAVLLAEDVNVAALILTHNHVDHAGGATTLLRNSGDWGGIAKTYLIKDDSPGTRTLRKFFKSEKRQKRVYPKDYLVLDPTGKPKILHQVRIMDDDLLIESLAPVPGEDFEAGDANEGSAVIRLRYRDFCVLFCGDSSMISWERIRRDEGRIRCEAVTVPHHGGHFRPKRSGRGPEWFFSDVVEAEKAIFSFSASNSYGHPRVEVVEAVRHSGAAVLYTQITPAVRSASTNEVTPPTMFSLSGRRPDLIDKDGRPLHIACAGSISVYFGPSGAQWGNLGAIEPICGFESIEHLRGLMDRRCPSRHFCGCL